MARGTFNNRRTQVGNKLRKFLALDIIESEYMKSKSARLPCADARKLFKMGYKLVEVIHVDQKSSLEDALALA